MSTLCWAACKALLEQQPAPMRDELVGFLSESGQAALKKAPKQKVLFTTLTPEEVLAEIHPSWLVAILQPFTENERGFFLATLSPVLATQLKKLLGMQKSIPSLTPLGKEYLRRELFELIKKDRGEALPKTALPDSGFNALLDFDASRLSLLAFWLGLHDLAEELRFVIDKQIWLRVEAALSSAEWQAVKTFQSKKEKLSFGRMALKDSLDSTQKLRIIIEQYGMNRMAKALYGEHPSLLWHIMLRLDPKRAEFFSKLSGPLSKPELREPLRQQIFTLIPLLPSGPKKAVES